MSKVAISATIDEQLYNCAITDSCTNKSKRIEELLRIGIEAEGKKEVSFKDCIEGMKVLLNNLSLLADGTLREMHISRFWGSIIIGKYNELFDGYVLRVIRVFNVDYYLTKGLKGTKVYYVVDGKPVELKRGDNTAEEKVILEKIKEYLNKDKKFLNEVEENKTLGSEENI